MVTQADIWNVTIQVEGLLGDRSVSVYYALKLADLYDRTPYPGSYRSFAEEILTSSAMYDPLNASRQAALDQAIAVAELQATGRM